MHFNIGLGKWFYLLNWRNFHDLLLKLLHPLNYLWWRLRDFFLWMDLWNSLMNFCFFTGGSAIVACASISELIFSKFFLNSAALCKISNVEEGCDFSGPSRTTLPLSFNLSAGTTEDLIDTYMSFFSTFCLCISSCIFNRSCLKCKA